MGIFLDECASISGQKMILTGPATSRLLFKGPNLLHTCQPLESLVSRLAVSTRLYSSILPSARNIHQGTVTNSVGARFEVYTRPILRKPVSQLRWKGRAYATSSPKIITKFEDLPADYTDFGGLPYYPRALAKQEVAALFGRGTDPAVADKLLRVLQGRRVAGTLNDPSLPLPDPRVDKAMKVIALKWLRKNIVVDERESAGLRAEIELEALGESIQGDQRSIPKDYNPQRKDGPYSSSGLDAIRAVKQREWDEAVAKRDELQKKRIAEIKEKTGTLSPTHDERGVELRRPGENHLLKHYTELAAKVVPDAPPEMSTFQRLWPSALVTLAVIFACIAFSNFYKPPKASERRFKDIPPAVVTIAPIIAFNALIFLAWRHPPAWRIMNKYFLSVPGYPRALAVLGNAFSHQSISHLAMNMFVIYYMGTQLHDDIGRGNFLALYFGTAVTGSFTALAYYVAKRRFHVSSLGASSVAYGIVAASFYLHWNDAFKLFGIFPPEPYAGIPGSWWLYAMIAYELWGMRQLHRKGGSKHDHVAHLGGAIGGVIAVEVMKRKAASRAAAQRRLRQARNTRGWN